MHRPAVRSSFHSAPFFSIHPSIHRRQQGLFVFIFSKYIPFSHFLWGNNLKKKKQKQGRQYQGAANVGLSRSVWQRQKKINTLVTVLLLRLPQTQRRGLESCSQSQLDSLSSLLVFFLLDFSVDRISKKKRRRPNDPADDGGVGQVDPLGSLFNYYVQYSIYWEFCAPSFFSYPRKKPQKKKIISLKGKLSRL